MLLELKDKKDAFIAEYRKKAFGRIRVYNLKRNFFVINDFTLGQYQLYYCNDKNECAFLFNFPKHIYSLQNVRNFCERVKVESVKK